MYSFALVVSCVASLSWLNNMLCSSCDWRDKEKLMNSVQAITATLRNFLDVFRKYKVSKNKLA